MSGTAKAFDRADEAVDSVNRSEGSSLMWIDAALLIIAIVLVLMGFAPIAPTNVGRTGLRTRLARQLHLWDRYLNGLH
jgi:uncharacterized membrane-anchored protein